MVDPPGVVRHICVRKVLPAGRARCGAGARCSAITHQSRCDREYLHSELRDRFAAANGDAVAPSGKVFMSIIVYIYNMNVNIYTYIFMYIYEFR